HFETKSKRSTSHFAQRKGVNTAPIWLADKLEFCVTILAELLNRLGAFRCVAPHPFIMLYRQICKVVVKFFDIPIPLNFVPHLVYCVVQTNLTRTEILNSIGVYR